VQIKIEWFMGARPQFNVSLASAQGKEPFLAIKGCRIVDGPDGKFVSPPRTKNEKTDKWWAHAWFSEGFNVAVLEAAEASMPKQDTRTHAERKRGDGFPKDVDNDIPF
jgi:hypothetical protein